MEARVHVSWHAVVRLRERDPEFAATDTTTLREYVASEVADAIASSRVASRLPRFCRPAEDARRPRGHRSPSIRYVWTANEQRVYVVNRTRRLITVITAIRAEAADTDADVDAA